METILPVQANPRQMIQIRVFIEGAPLLKNTRGSVERFWRRGPKFRL